MKSVRKMTGEQRRVAIIQAARKVFVEKGFHGATSRALAEAAGVSEALLFKHFPTKEALYSAILRFGAKKDVTNVLERITSLEPSTASLVRLVWGFASHILSSRPDEEDRVFFRLLLRSLMEEGGFTRVALEGIPLHWVQKVAECLEAAKRAGDLVAPPTHAWLAGWLVHHLISGFLMHLFPEKPLIDYKLPREELIEQVVWFCLRGIGLREEAIREYLEKLNSEPGDPR